MSNLDQLKQQARSLIPYLVAFMVGAGAASLVYKSKTQAALEERSLEYNKQKEQYVNQIRNLEIKVNELRETVSTFNLETVETFDASSGNLVQRQTKQQTTTSSKEASATQVTDNTKTVTVTVEKEKLAEKEKIVRVARKKWGHTLGIKYDSVLRTTAMPDGLYGKVDYNLDFVVDRVEVGFETNIIDRDFGVTFGVTKECNTLFCLGG